MPRTLVLGLEGVSAAELGEALDGGALPQLALLLRGGTRSTLQIEAPSIEQRGGRALAFPTHWRALWGAQSEPELPAGGLRPTASEVELETFEPPKTLWVLQQASVKTWAAASGAGAGLLFFLVFFALVRMSKTQALTLSLALGLLAGWGGARARSYVPALFGTWLPPPAPSALTGPLALATAPLGTEALGTTDSSVLLLGDPFAGELSDGVRCKTLSWWQGVDARAGFGDVFLYDSGATETKQYGGTEGDPARAIILPMPWEGRETVAWVYGPDAVQGGVPRPPALGRSLTEASPIAVPLRLRESGEGDLRVEMGGEVQDLTPGIWSEAFPVQFAVNPLLHLRAQVHVLVLEADGDRYRVLISPIEVNAAHPPFWQAQTKPVSLGRRVAETLQDGYPHCGPAGLFRFRDELEISDELLSGVLEGDLHRRLRALSAGMQHAPSDVTLALIATWRLARPWLDTGPAGQLAGKRVPAGGMNRALLGVLDKRVGELWQARMHPGDRLVLVTDADRGGTALVLANYAIMAPGQEPTPQLFAQGLLR